MIVNKGDFTIFWNMEILALPSIRRIGEIPHTTTLHKVTNYYRLPFNAF